MGVFAKIGDASGRRTRRKSPCFQEGQELESRQLLTGIEAVGPATAAFVAGFGTEKLNEKVNAIFSGAGSSWTCELTAQLGDTSGMSSGLPGHGDFDVSVAASIDSTSSVIQTQVATVGTAIASTHADLSFAGGFDFGDNVTYTTYEGGVMVCGSKGWGDFTDWGSFWFQGETDWTNPSPAEGVALDKVVATASVWGMSPSVFQGEVTIDRKLEMINGDKKNFGLNVQYFGNDDWIVNGSVTRKSGPLTLTANAHLNDNGFDQYGVQAEYATAGTNFLAGYDFDNGYDSWFADFKHEDLVNYVFANARVEKDLMDNILATATFAKSWSGNEWLILGAGIVNFADPSLENFRTAMASYSVKSTNTIFQRITGSFGYSDDEWQGGLPVLSENGTYKSPTELQFSVEQFHDSLLGVIRATLNY